jgi:hypothetical protein
MRVYGVTCDAWKYGTYLAPVVSLTCRGTLELSMKKIIIAFLFAIAIALIGCCAISDAIHRAYERSQQMHAKRIYLGIVDGQRWFLSDESENAYLIKESLF